MVRKRNRKQNSSKDDIEPKVKTDKTSSKDEKIGNASIDAMSDLFRKFNALRMKWMDQERDGIATLEAFETAIGSYQEFKDPAVSNSIATTTEEANDLNFVQNLNSFGNNISMDPLLLEELYAKVQDICPAFQTILHKMYSIYNESKSNAISANGYSLTPLLSVVDYVQAFGNQLNSFEAEYQHIEVVLSSISFNMTKDALRTATIAWSASPFLETEAWEEFQSLHALTVSHS